MYIHGVAICMPTHPQTSNFHCQFLYVCSSYSSITENQMIAYTSKLSQKLFVLDLKNLEEK